MDGGLILPHLPGEIDYSAISSTLFRLSEKQPSGSSQNLAVWSGAAAFTESRVQSLRHEWRYKPSEAKGLEKGFQTSVWNHD